MNFRSLPVWRLICGNLSRLQPVWAVEVQMQQPFFISTGAFGASEGADRVNGVPVSAGHFHHRGSLRHCSSWNKQIEGGALAPSSESKCLHLPSVASTRPCAVGWPKKKKQHRVASCAACWVLGRYSFSFSIPSVGIGNCPM